MSVVFINYSRETFTPTHSGAICTYIWELCRAAARAGASPQVVSLASTQPPYSDVPTHFVAVPADPKSYVPFKLLRLRRKLTGWQHIRQWTFAFRVAGAIVRDGLAGGPFVLHNDPEVAVVLKSRFPGARVQLHLHNHLECSPRFVRALQTSGVQVSAVSRFTADWVERFYGLEAGSVKAIYNGVDVERFRPLTDPAPGAPIIQFCGRTGIEKAPDLVLRAALALAERTRGFRVRIIGWNSFGWFTQDAYQTRLTELAEKLEALGIEVSRPGHVDRKMLPEMVRTGHIHVTPSRWDEPFGLTTLEGMASGLATVGSRTGGTPEVIGEAGLLFERDDERGLAGCLEDLVCDDTARSRYRQLALDRAASFSWDRTWQQLCATL
jgi:glycosyltransferase involved in cell wall biosynthesis